MSGALSIEVEDHKGKGKLLEEGSPNTVRLEGFNGVLLGAGKLDFAEIAERGQRPRQRVLLAAD